MTASHIEREKKTVELMIRLYCRKKEKIQFFVPTVKSCSAMPTHVSTIVRLERRRVHAKECTVHCYKPVMRERMRQVMRFSGPRMLLYAPWQAIRHLLNL